MKECSIGFLAFCNGHQVVFDSLNSEVKGLFSLKTAKRADYGITLYSPVIKNISDDELVFNKAFVSVILPPGPYEAFTQYSKWSNENQGSWLPLGGRGIILNTANGRTTEGNSPYLAMRMLGARDGIAFHVLPVGDWRIRVMPLPFSNDEPPIRVDLGISDETLAFRLAPGESWALPEVIVHHFDDFDEAPEMLHGFLPEALNLKYKKLPVEYNTWLDVYAKLDVARLERQLAAAKAIGCEVFVVDAGWFGPGDSSWATVGDWREKTDAAFFGKMADFADKVRKNGLEFGFWIEPERFNPNAPVVKEHPEWFTKTGSCYRIELEIPEAYQYQKKTIFSLIDKYKARYIKTDMNAQLGIDDSGAAHYRYARLFYQLMDEVRAAYPDLVLECCASGALRTDLEALKHFDVFFPSDSSNPFTQTDMFIGFWQRFLPSKLMRWITLRELKDAPPLYGGKANGVVVAPYEGTWEEFFAVDLESVLAASFACGQYGFTGDLDSLSAENRQLVKKYVSLFKKFRRHQKMDCFCLVDTPTFKVLEILFGKTPALIVQYIASEKLGTRKIYPRGLDWDKHYSVNGEKVEGTDLELDGFDFTPKYTSQHGKWRAEMILL